MCYFVWGAMVTFESHCVQTSLLSILSSSVEGVAVQVLPELAAKWECTFKRASNSPCILCLSVCFIHFFPLSPTHTLPVLRFLSFFLSLHLSLSLSLSPKHSLYLFFSLTDLFYLRVHALSVSHEHFLPLRLSLPLALFIYFFLSFLLLSLSLSLSNTLSFFRFFLSRLHGLSLSH